MSRAQRLNFNRRKINAYDFMQIYVAHVIVTSLILQNATVQNWFMLIIFHIVGPVKFH